MKINAVTNRGSKKDFSDLLLLHEQGNPDPLTYGCLSGTPAGRDQYSARNPRTGSTGSPLKN